MGDVASDAVRVLALSAPRQPPTWMVSSGSAAALLIGNYADITNTPLRSQVIARELYGENGVKGKPYTNRVLFGRQITHGTSSGYDEAKRVRWVYEGKQDPSDT